MSLQNEYEGKTLWKAIIHAESPRLVELTEDECKALCESVSFKFRPGYEKRVVERITSTEAVDRDGDIIRAHGIDNKQFRIEPVVLFTHNRHDTPVGRSLKEWIDKKITGWRSWDMFFDNDIDTTGKSDLIFRLVDSGGMRGGSIGFLPISAKYDHSEEDRKKLGLGKYGIEFQKVLKLEHSACSVPANQEALAAGLKSIDAKRFKNLIHKEDLDIMEKQNVIDVNLIDVFADVLGVKPVVSLPPEEKMEDCDTEYVQKPYPNEHACRLNDPDKYEKFGRVERKHNSKSYSVIRGKLKGSDKWEEQAFRYVKDVWTESEARTHCKDHKGSFEAAKKDEENITNVNLNIDLTKINDELCIISKTLKTFAENMENIEKSMTERFTSLIAIAEKVVSAVELKRTETGLYDRKEFEDILTLGDKH